MSFKVGVVLISTETGRCQEGLFSTRAEIAVFFHAVLLLFWTKRAYILLSLFYL